MLWVPFFYVTVLGLLPNLYSPLNIATMNRSSTVLSVDDFQAEPSDLCRAKRSPPQTPWNATAINHTAWKTKSKVLIVSFNKFGVLYTSQRAHVFRHNKFCWWHLFLSKFTHMPPTHCMHHKPNGQEFTQAARTPTISSQGSGFFHKN